MMFDLLDRALGISQKREVPYLERYRPAGEIEMIGERAAIRIGRAVHDLSLANRAGSDHEWSSSSVVLHMTEDDVLDFERSGSFSGFRWAARELAKSVPPDVQTGFSVHHGYGGACAWHEYTIFVHRLPRGEWMG